MSGAHIRVGGYLAVQADGTICCGYKNGMKLYAYVGPAIKRAGPGGTVFHMYHNGYGMIVQRHTGPRVNVAIDAPE